MSDILISIDNLSKRYLIGHQAAQLGHHVTLRDTVMRELRGFKQRAVDLVRGHQIILGDEIEEYWALKNVSFEVRRGEVIGIIGRNGAGKSTLLKILSRITEPTKGRVRIHGRVTSLLEVGTGFHPELTGRENIFLNGAILGMSREEIRRKFDEIVEFAEVRRFLDTPVKHYSSGMYVRLAFAVAAHLEPEILIVDEVLAVGDAEFQKKCLGKMSSVAKSGRTVLFVSHNSAAIRNLCSHGIVMRAGLSDPKVDVETALENYLNIKSVQRSSWVRPAVLGKSSVYFESIEVTLVGAQPNLQLACTVQIRSEPGGRPVYIAVDFFDKYSVAIMQAEPKFEPFIGGTPGLYRVDLNIELPPLVPGIYTLDFWIGSHNTQTLDYIRGSLAIDIVDSPSAGRIYPYSPQHHGNIVPRSTALVTNES